MRGRLLVVMALVVAAAQIGFLAWTIVGRAAILRNGTEIALTIQPVDPRDLLRGDFVSLSYNISRLPKILFAQTPDDAGTYRHRTIHVRLKPGSDGIWQAVSASVDRPPDTAPAAGEVDIRGTAYTNWTDNGQDVFVRYGIERYFVPEGEGRALETDPDLRSFVMRVAVSREGNAQIKALYDGDRLVYAEPLY
jgi:uncharacterized membrane-anchored protein